MYLGREDLDDRQARSSSERRQDVLDRTENAIAAGTRQAPATVTVASPPVSTTTTIPVTAISTGPSSIPVIPLRPDKIIEPPKTEPTVTVTQPPVTTTTNIPIGGGTSSGSTIPLPATVDASSNIPLMVFGGLLLLIMMK